MWALALALAMVKEQELVRESVRVTAMASVQGRVTAKVRVLAPETVMPPAWVPVKALRLPTRVRSKPASHRRRHRCHRRRLTIAMSPPSRRQGV